MTFINTKTKITYYLFMVFHTIISILIFSSFFYLEDLTLPSYFYILFFGSFFMQIGIESLVVLLYYSFTESKKNKIIHGVHITYVGWGVNFISVLPLEFGIAALVVFGYSLIPFYLALIGGFVFLILILYGKILIFILSNLKNPPKKRSRR